MIVVRKFIFREAHPVKTYWTNYHEAMIISSVGFEFVRSTILRIMRGHCCPKECRVSVSCFCLKYTSTYIASATNVHKPSLRHYIPSEQRLLFSLVPNMCCKLNCNLEPESTPNIFSWMFFKAVHVSTRLKNLPVHKYGNCSMLVSTSQSHKNRTSTAFM